MASESTEDRLSMDDDLTMVLEGEDTPVMLSDEEIISTDPLSPSWPRKYNSEDHMDADANKEVSEELTEQVEDQSTKQIQEDTQTTLTFKPRDEDVIEMGTVTLHDTSLTGFKRGEVLYLPFNHSMEKLNLTDHCTMAGLGKRRERMGLPTFHALPKELQRMKQAGLVTGKSTRCVVSPSGDILKLLKEVLPPKPLLKPKKSTTPPPTKKPCLQSVDSKPCTPVSATKSKGNDQSIDDSDDDKHYAIGRRKVGRRRKLFKENLPRSIQEKMENMRKHYMSTIPVNPRTQPSPLASKTMERTETHTLGEL